MRSERFLEGLTTGMFGSAVGASALLYILRRSELVSFSVDRSSLIRPWLDWAYSNLGLSIPVFAVVLIAYFLSLARLRSYINNGRPINEIVQLDHLTDIVKHTLRTRFGPYKDHGAILEPIHILICNHIGPEVTIP